jgi:hypothetical protein
VPAAEPAKAEPKKYADCSRIAKLPAVAAPMATARKPAAAKPRRAARRNEILGILPPCQVGVTSA